MGLPKFLAGRIHQMRSGKSYLAAHRPTWQDEPVETTCPRCSSEEESFTHAVFSCPLRACAKTRFLPGVTSLDQESPVWSTPSLVVALAEFIKATATGFPDNMPPLGTGSPTLETALPPRLYLGRASSPLLPKRHLSAHLQKRGVPQLEDCV